MPYAIISLLVRFEKLQPVSPKFVRFMFLDKKNLGIDKTS